MEGIVVSVKMTVDCKKAVIFKGRKARCEQSYGDGVNCTW